MFQHSPLTIPLESVDRGPSRTLRLDAQVGLGGLLVEATKLLQYNQDILDERDALRARVLELEAEVKELRDGMAQKANGEIPFAQQHVTHSQTDLRRLPRWSIFSPGAPHTTEHEEPSTGEPSISMFVNMGIESLEELELECHATPINTNISSPVSTSSLIFASTSLTARAPEFVPGGKKPAPIKITNPDGAPVTFKPEPRQERERPIKAEFRKPVPVTVRIESPEDKGKRVVLEETKRKEEGAAAAETERAEEERTQKVKEEAEAEERRIEEAEETESRRVENEARLKEEEERVKREEGGRIQEKVNRLLQLELERWRLEEKQFLKEEEELRLAKDEEARRLEVELLKQEAENTAEEPQEKERWVGVP